MFYILLFYIFYIIHACFLKENKHLKSYKKQITLFPLTFTVLYIGWVNKNIIGPTMKTITMNSKIQLQY